MEGRTRHFAKAEVGHTRSLCTWRQGRGSALFSALALGASRVPPQALPSRPEAVERRRRLIWNHTANVGKWELALSPLWGREEQQQGPCVQ